MPRKPTLSPTRIATYLECAMKYRYIYIDKIGRFFLKARPYYSFGSTLHQVLQDFHAEGGTKSAEAMVEQYDGKWITAGYETPEQESEYRTAGAEMVRAYHSSASERIERKIETIYTEKTIKTDLGSFILAGRVDRVDRHQNGVLEIVDYKSGRTDVTSDEVAGNMAMSIYQLIMRKMNPGVRILATIYCLRSGNSATVEMSEAVAATFESDIRVLGEEIINRDYEHVEPIRIEACVDCDFISKCERFWKMEALRETAQ